jgi:hypothetical protein
MANSPDTDDSIEGLLEQRTRFEQWLAKLDGSGNKAPAAVRHKVRADYEARLRGVIERLRGHSATITQELERHQASRSDLDGRRRGAEEELAEAEVRYAVGEFTEDEWGRIRDESERRLASLRAELTTVGSEISRLAEVQSLISAPARPPEAPAPTPAPAPAPPPPKEEVIERAPPPPPPPPAAEPAPVEPPAAQRMPRPPRPQPEPAPAAADNDELAFLKSVAEEDQRKPASTRRPSNPGVSAPAQGSRAVEAPAATAPGKPGAPGVAKTLKCGECGTLNRPTEWYCERCGAELAGI